jgi:hypothetical protein
VKPVQRGPAEILGEENFLLVRWMSRLRSASDPAIEDDVHNYVPSTEKARRILAFDATPARDEMLDSVIPWIKKEGVDVKS